MTPADAVPAVLLSFDYADATEPTPLDTTSAPWMCSGVEEAVAALQARKAALVLVDDAAAVLRALRAQVTP